MNACHCPFSFAAHAHACNAALVPNSHYKSHGNAAESCVDSLEDGSEGEEQDRWGGDRRLGGALSPEQVVAETAAAEKAAARPPKEAGMAAYRAVLLDDCKGERRNVTVLDFSRLRQDARGACSSAAARGAG